MFTNNFRQEVTTAEQTLKILANKLRLQLLYLLENEEQSSRELANKLQMDHSLVKHHLERLQEFGFISTSEGNSEDDTYRINFSRFQPVSAILKRTHTLETRSQAIQPSRKVSTENKPDPMDREWYTNAASLLLR